MVKRCLILILFFVAGCGITQEIGYRANKKKLEFSRIDKTHCVEIGNKAAAACSARCKAIPGKAIKDKILADYRKELAYRGATEEVKSKLLQMTEYVVKKAYELNPPFKTESDAKKFGKEYCEKQL
ncbi:MAG: hypothetical protein AMJ53_16300 [Gammaproteobacteria bacterium SG8_11]|nr:MAG: hypothetical protein AMJ53_16300 [Gammaproteobacteria bacterium SG8_11]